MTNEISIGQRNYHGIIRTNTNTLECLYFQNSNVLSAILCLIKEIDGPSLEVVEMAVRCRMEELEDWEPRSCIGGTCPSTQSSERTQYPWIETSILTITVACWLSGYPCLVPTQRSTSMWDIGKPDMCLNQPQFRVFYRTSLFLTHASILHPPSVMKMQGPLLISYTHSPYPIHCLNESTYRRMATLECFNHPMKGVSNLNSRAWKCSHQGLTLKIMKQNVLAP